MAACNLTNTGLQDRLAFPLMMLHEWMTQANLRTLHGPRPTARRAALPLRCICCSVSGATPQAHSQLASGKIWASSRRPGTAGPQPSLTSPGAVHAYCSLLQGILVQAAPIRQALV